mmetsp:Transcript_501/g.1424  ORF Transcript_501/g.1424 Transcript_501/m.1424 type:complete len:254 (+) Transcript_501:23-784(+)
MLKGHVALVTGGSGGIGQAICRRLANQGARIAVQYCQGSHAVQELLGELNGPHDGGCHFALQTDLSNSNEVENMVSETIGTAKRIDILVNNAGIAIPHPPLEVDYTAWCDAFQKTLQVNLTGPANATYCAAQSMISGGRIINISSRGAFRGEPDYPAYGCSKAALNSLSQSMAVALAPKGVSVYAIAPGFVETPMAAPFLDGESGDAIRNQSPLGRVATPEDVAYWVACLSSPEAAFATGTIIDVNGASYLRS